MTAGTAFRAMNKVVPAKIVPDRPGCRAPLFLFPVIRQHDWVPVEAIGQVVTYHCECGKAKTRVTSRLSEPLHHENPLAQPAQQRAS